MNVGGGGVRGLVLGCPYKLQVRFLLFPNAETGFASRTHAGRGLSSGTVLGTSCVSSVLWLWRCEWTDRAMRDSLPSGLRGEHLEVRFDVELIGVESLVQVVQHILYT